MQDTTKENNFYKRYQELGGIINEKDYKSALVKAKNTAMLNTILIKQLEHIAEFAGIRLHSAKDVIDERIILYVILRTDTKSKEEAEYHHSQMSDQRLFAEALRMLGDVDSLNKLINAHPNIAFN